MKKSRRKMAFTLTELLVVVVIIGVLAAVVMPKYARMLDTRKTTEAEEIMRAIRTEQERRCSLGKDYATNMTQLADLVPNANSQYYTYALFDNGKGVTATTAAGSSLNYTLRMPSVVDGRICCEGGNCDQLNKDYPSCTNFQYVRAGGCSSEVGEGDDPFLPPTPPIPPTPPNPTECTDPKPDDDGELTDCDGSIQCGKKRKRYICENGNWIVTWDTSACAPCDCHYGWVISPTKREVVTCSECQTTQSLAPTQPCPYANCHYCTVKKYDPVNVTCAFDHCEEGGRAMGPDGGEQNFSCDDHGQGSNLYINPVAYCVMTYSEEATCQLTSGDPIQCPLP